MLQRSAPSPFAPLSVVPPADLAPLHPKPGPRRTVAIARGPDIILAALDQVRYFRAEGKYTRVLLAGEEGLLNLGITAVQAQLPEGDFLKVHRSVVVNLGLVRKICRDELGHMYLCLHSRTERVQVSRIHEPLFRVGIF